MLKSCSLSTNENLEVQSGCRFAVSYQSKNRIGMSRLEAAISLCITITLAIFSFHFISRTSAQPSLEEQVATAMRAIESGILDYKMETGNVPTSIEELPILLEDAIVPSELIAELLTTGIDPWGQPLQLVRISEETGKFELRSLGSDERRDKDSNGDDIVISFNGDQSAESD